MNNTFEFILNYENIDFSVLKQYLNIFIDMIDVQIKVKNLPVTRKENNNNEKN